MTSTTPPTGQDAPRSLVLGVEAFLQNPPELVRGQRLGLVTSAAAVDSQLRTTIELLAEASRSGAHPWRLTRLFAPEHGLRGDAPAGVPIEDTTDPITGLPVSSLYGPHRRPTPAMLADVDVLVIDLVDVGARFYTYGVTMAECLVAGATHGRPVVVLDRPNPLGGLQVEGPRLQPGFESFVGRAHQPIRHGLTLGELARAIAHLEGLAPSLQLHVVPLQGWQRAQWADQTGLPWVLPSPNLPTLESATVYPGTGLLEGTTLSEGRGTTRPFELVGAPGIAPERWATRLNALATAGQLPGVRFRPCWFVPWTSKHAGVRCGGVQLHVTDRTVFRPVATGVWLLATAWAEWPQVCSWRPPRAPQGAGQPSSSWPIDRLYGSAALREHLAVGAPVEAVEAVEALLAAPAWDLRPWEAVCQQVRLYP